MNKSWKKNRTVECIVHMATWALVRFGLGVKGPEYLMTHQGWENWGNQWMNGLSPKRSKGDCRRRKMNCLKATVRNEITNTWSVREWEDCGGSATFLEQPTSNQKSNESCVCWLACLFLHVPILRHSMTVAAPKSSWPLRAPLEGHSQIFWKRIFPWSRPKEMTFCLNHLVPSALSPQITKTLKATFSELSKLIYAPFWEPSHLSVTKYWGSVFFSINLDSRKCYEI